MHKRRIVLILTGLILIALAGLAFIWSQPQVIEVEPAQGTNPVPAGSALRIRFSRPIQIDSVAAKLTIDPPRSGEFTWDENTLVFTPDQPWPSGAMITVRLEPGARAAGFPFRATRQPTSWTFTIGHPRLVYLYPSDAPAGLYLLDPQNGEIQQLSQAPGSILEYSINSAGTAIYYNLSQEAGGSSIYRLDRLSGSNQLILDCPEALCRYPQISPQEDYLAFERTALAIAGEVNKPQVWVLPLNIPQAGEEPIQFGEPFLVADADHKTQQPLWTPAGLLTYYDYDRMAFIVQDPQGEEIVHFPSQTGIAGAWDPQGQHYVIPEIYLNEIADPNILTDVGSLPSSRLLKHSLDGSIQDLTQADNVEDSSPAFSPDGNSLVFARKYLDVTRWTHGRQIWHMSADGEQPIAITQDSYYNHYDLVWSPDGTRLAYTRFNKNSLIDPPELWLMNADGSGATRLVSGAYSPQWIP
jgi:Tol biopolymer transport system component